MYPEYMNLQGNKRSGTLYKEIIKLQQKSNQLQSNWNSLRKWLEDKNNQQYSKFIPNYSINNWVLDRMNELESGDNK